MNCNWNCGVALIRKKKKREISLEQTLEKAIQKLDLVEIEFRRSSLLCRRESQRHHQTEMERNRHFCEFSFLEFEKNKI